MKVEFVEKPFEHFLLEDIFNDQEFEVVTNEIKTIGESAFSNNSDILKSNETSEEVKRTGFWLSNVYKDFRRYSNVYKLCAGKLYGEEALDYFYSVSVLGKYIKWSTSDDMLITKYQDQDHYERHHDRSSATALIHIWNKDFIFKGGDLIFPEYNYTYKVKNNSGIIFPGCVMHEVNKITCSDTQPGSGRFCITNFIHVR
jgi:hypothetical protein